MVELKPTVQFGSEFGLATPETARWRPAAGADQPRDARILLVAPSSVMREVEQLVLRNSGYEVVVAGTLAEAAVARRAGAFSVLVLYASALRGDVGRAVASLREKHAGAALLVLRPGDAPPNDPDLDALADAVLLSPPATPHVVAERINALIAEPISFMVGGV